MAVEVVDNQFLIARPAAPCHHHHTIGGKLGYGWEILCGGHDIGNTVEAGIAGNNAVDTDSTQKCLRIGILDIYSGRETAEHTTEHRAVWPEEEL